MQEVYCMVTQQNGKEHIDKKSSQQLVDCLSKIKNCCSQLEFSHTDIFQLIVNRNTGIFKRDIPEHLQLLTDSLKDRSITLSYNDNYKNSPAIRDWITNKLCIGFCMITFGDSY